MFYRNQGASGCASLHGKITYWYRLHTFVAFELAVCAYLCSSVLAFFFLHQQESEKALRSSEKRESSLHQ